MSPWSSPTSPPARTVMTGWLNSPGHRANIENPGFTAIGVGAGSRDGRLYRGKTGVAWLALTAGAPVVPVALTGTQNLQPVGSKRVRLARVTIEFGAPMDISAFGPASSGRARRHATDAIMARIQSMSGQEYVDQYNEPPPATVRERVRRFFRTRSEL